MIDTLPIWPNTLPKPSVDYSIQRAATGVTRTEMASGYYRQRQIYEVNNDLINVTLNVSNVDMQVFDNFLRNVLKGGAMAFVGEYLDGEDYHKGVVQIIGGQASSKYLAADLWRISFQLYVVDRVPGLDDLAFFYSTLKNYEDAEMKSLFLAIRTMMYGNDLTNPNGVPEP